MGQALRLEVILLSKEKVAAPRPSPEAGLAGGLAGGLEAGVEAGLAGLEAQGGKPSKPSKPSTPFKTLQTPSPTGTQGQGHFSIRPPRAKATAMAFYWLSKLPFASPQTLQTLQNPPNTIKTLQTLQAWRHALSRWPKGYGS